jgi:hypothetical protein
VISSKTQLANLSFLHLGMANPVSNADTDDTTEAKVFRVAYPVALDEVLSEAPWGFATEVVELGLVTDSEDDDHPNEEWDYSYRYPSDCVTFRKIQSGVTTDTRDTRIAYRLAQDATGKLIFTDEESAVGEYTKREEDVSRYPANFVQALALKIAIYAAPTLVGGDEAGLQNRAMNLYDRAINQAKADMRNEEQMQPDADSELIRARE